MRERERDQKFSKSRSFIIVEHFTGGEGREREREKERARERKREMEFKIVKE